LPAIEQLSLIFEDAKIAKKNKTEQEIVEKRTEATEFQHEKEERRKKIEQLIMRKYIKIGKNEYFCNLFCKRKKEQLNAQAGEQVLLRSIS